MYTSDYQLVNYINLNKKKNLYADLNRKSNNNLFIYFIEQNQGSQMLEEGRSEAWRHETQQDFRYTSTPPEGHFPMQNGGSVNFETPKVPVIFVLGK